MSCLCLIKYHRKGEKRGEGGGGGGGGGSVVFIQGVNGERERVLVVLHLERHKNVKWRSRKKERITKEGKWRRKTM